VPTFTTQWLTFAAFLAAGILLYVAAVTANRLVRPAMPSPAKLSTYECGVDPAGSGWTQMNIRYYVYAFLFVIFDVEAVFLFPWAVLLGELGPDSLISPTFALVAMFLFIATLFEGLVYAWRKGVLRWD
jgi:NADH-quinone oxidoreductase subunit A